MTRLAQCPFCGNSKAPKERYSYTNDYTEVCQIWCSLARDGCGAQTWFYDTQGEAVEAWNRREA